MNATLRLQTSRHAPLLRCSGRCAQGECPVLDSDAAPRRSIVQSPFTRRALAGTLPAKIVR